MAGPRSKSLLFAFLKTVRKAQQKAEILSPVQIRPQHAVPVTKPNDYKSETDTIKSSTDDDIQSLTSGFPPFKTQQQVFKQPLVLQAETNREMDFVRLCQAAEISPKIGFIGGGNMAQAMIKGYISSGLLSCDKIGVSDPFPSALDSAKAIGVSTETSNRRLLENFSSGLVILAVKPDALGKVLEDSKDLLRNAGILVTIIAGATIETIENQLCTTNDCLPIVRVMPNTAAIVGCAASVFCRGRHVSDAQADLVKTLMETFGSCREVNEKHLDAVTGLSGSGPAFGAAKMVLETGKHPGDLKNMVCSPGGTTITGVSVLEERGLRGTLIAAVEAAGKKSQELGAK